MSKHHASGNWNDACSQTLRFAARRAAGISGENAEKWLAAEVGQGCPVGGDGPGATTIHVPLRCTMAPCDGDRVRCMWFSAPGAWRDVLPDHANGSHRHAGTACDSYLGGEITEGAPIDASPGKY